MSTMLKNFLVTISIVFLFVQGCKADAVDDNLARGKSYSLTPKPNYSLCTDASDLSQLTDGRTSDSKWTSTSTVGWVRSGAIEITIDLQDVCHLDRIAVQSVGGGWAEVEYPEFLVVTVSTDGARFGVAGLLRTDGMPVKAGRKEPHVFEIGNLNATGRYVRLLVRTQGRSHTFFSDEIAIYGKKSNNGRTYREPASLVSFSQKHLLSEGIEEYFQIARNLEEIKRVVDAEPIRLRGSLSEPHYNSYRRYVQMFLESETEFHDLKALKGIHREIGLIKAAILNQVHGKQFICYSADPMDALLEKEMPPMRIDRLSSLRVFQWQDEYEPAAVNIVNCSQQPLDFRVSLSPLVDEQGKQHASEDVITVRRAVYVRAMNLGRVADPLVLQQDKMFTAPPGQLTQIWLTIDSSGLSPSTYCGTLALVASSGELQTMPIRIEIAPIQFPERPTFRGCVWDEYITTAKSFVRRQPLVAIKDLVEHYINVGVIQPSYIPLPGKSRNRLYASDFAALDHQLELRKDFEVILLYLGGENYFEERFSGLWMSEEWKADFAVWLREIIAHMKLKGFDYSRFAIYPYDEKIHDRLYEIAQLIRQTDPKVQIYANWFREGYSNLLRFKNVIDIWCLLDSHCDTHLSWANKINEFGKPVWTYEAFGPGKANHPLYYRKLPWKAFKRNQTGAGFWVYLDWEMQTGWDDTETVKGYYAVVYDGKYAPADCVREPLVTSRRWEAWRQGAEDYEYLHMLKTVLAVGDSHSVRKEIGGYVDSMVKGEYAGLYEIRKRISELYLKHLRSEQVPLKVEN